VVGMKFGLLKFGLLFGCLIKKIKPCDFPPAYPPVPGGSQLVAGWVPKACVTSASNSNLFWFRHSSWGREFVNTRFCEALAQVESPLTSLSFLRAEKYLSLHAMNPLTGQEECVTMEQ